jgi:diguanylate cyclase (GGDEF)-like protein
MKIGDPNAVRAAAALRKAAALQPTRPTGGAAARDDARSERTADTTEVLGIPEAEFTPKVRAALMQLMAEVQSLRQELAQSRMRIEQLERLADQDTLTPVPNRRAFVRELSRMMSFAERYSAPSSVIYIDVNGLKKMNDQYGHGAGDAALMHVARILSGNIRDSDFVGRLGGDEFGVILAYADGAAAHDKATTLAELIAQEPFQWNGETLHVSIAWGAHPIMPGGLDVAATLDAADRAMYAQKRKSTEPAQ